MANKTIGQLEDSNHLDGNDFIAVYNAEASVDSFTYKTRINDVLDLKSITINGKTGSTITINADDISDASATKKFVTATEKNKIGIIKTDQGVNAFLAGDGTYKAIPRLSTIKPSPAFSRVLIGVEPDQATDPFKRETIVSVGMPISGNTSFFWMFSVPERVKANSVNIKDVTNDTYIATGLTTNNYNGYNAGYAIVDIGTIPNDAPMTHVWQIELKDELDDVVQSSELKIISV